MKYESLSGEPSQEERAEHAWQAYAGALQTYYIGVTQEEIQRDTTKHNLIETIKEFGGFSKPIDRTDVITIGEHLFFQDEVTVGQRVEKIRTYEPELATVIDTAINLQQLLYKEDDPDNRTYISKILSDPFVSLRGYLGWSQEDAIAIRQIGYSKIDEEAADEVSDFSSHFVSQAKMRGVSLTEKTPNADAYAKAASSEILTRLRNTEISEKVASMYRLDVNAALSLRKLEAKIPTIPNVPRIAKQTYIDQLARNLLFDHRETVDRSSLPQYTIRPEDIRLLPKDPPRLASIRVR